jgi:hypothetical protein
VLAQLESVLDAQQGLVSLAQLEAAGIDRHKLARLIQRNVCAAFDPVCTHSSAQANPGSANYAPSLCRSTVPSLRIAPPLGCGPSRTNLRAVTR